MITPFPLPPPHTPAHPHKPTHTHTHPQLRSQIARLEEEKKQERREAAESETRWHREVKAMEAQEKRLLVQLDELRRAADGADVISELRTRVDDAESYAEEIENDLRALQAGSAPDAASVAHLTKLLREAEARAEEAVAAAAAAAAAPAAAGAVETGVPVVVADQVSQPQAPSAEVEQLVADNTALRRALAVQKDASVALREAKAAIRRLEDEVAEGAVVAAAAAAEVAVAVAVAPSAPAAPAPAPAVAELFESEGAAFASACVPACVEVVKEVEDTEAVEELQAEVEQLKKELDKAQKAYDKVLKSEKSLKEKVKKEEKARKEAEKKVRGHAKAAKVEEDARERAEAAEEACKKAEAAAEEARAELRIAETMRLAHEREIVSLNDALGEARAKAGGPSERERELDKYAKHYKKQCQVLKERVRELEGALAASAAAGDSELLEQKLRHLAAALRQAEADLRAEKVKRRDLYNTIQSKFTAGAGALTAATKGIDRSFSVAALQCRALSTMPGREQGRGRAESVTSSRSSVQAMPAMRRGVKRRRSEVQEAPGCDSDSESSNVPPPKRGRSMAARRAAAAAQHEDAAAGRRETLGRHALAGRKGKVPLETLVQANSSTPVRVNASGRLKLKI